ncbi:MAG: hypothetical protein HGB04_10685 [Chlorobiaceae bacterium]|nr:hypothetical protein [Chlorobiaceae bacterium]
MRIPVKSNRLTVVESIVDECFVELPRTVDEILAYASGLGRPLTVDEAVEVRECLVQISALAAKGVIVDDGRFCGVVCDGLKPTRGQRVAKNLESLRSWGATHVAGGYGCIGALMSIDQAVSEYHDLEDNTFGLGPLEPDQMGLFPCDGEGRRISEAGIA